jgi:UDP-N-acetylglucosamine 2-epimerase
VNTVSVVGDRSDFIKIAPLANAFERRSQAGALLQHTIVHTGQHSDAVAQETMLSEGQLPHAQLTLGVGPARDGSQTAAMLAKLEDVLLAVDPDLLVVYGDTNSTVAGALAGTKLGIPVAHVGAGLRTFSRRTPEDINRTAADHICDLLLAPSPTAMKNLASEALAPRSVFTGDSLYDAVLLYRALAAQRSTIGGRLNLQPGAYAFATIQRAENIDDSVRLGDLLATFNEVAGTFLPLVFPMDPRIARSIRSQFVDWKPHPALFVVDPGEYLDTLWLMDHAAMTLTDSGAQQQEAFFLGCPCITLTDETVWTETVEAGGNILASADPARILAAVARSQRYHRREDGNFSQVAAKVYGSGDAAERILSALLQFLGRNV